MYVHTYTAIYSLEEKTVLFNLSEIYVVVHMLVKCIVKS